jgi:hypothetical protein
MNRRRFVYEFAGCIFMVSIGAETNEREASRTSRSDLPTGAILDSAEGHSIPKAGSTGPADIVMMDAALLDRTIAFQNLAHPLAA